MPLTSTKSFIAQWHAHSLHDPTDHAIFRKSAGASTDRRDANVHPRRKVLDLLPLSGDVRNVRSARELSLANEGGMARSKFLAICSPLIPTSPALPPPPRP